MDNIADKSKPRAALSPEAKSRITSLVVRALAGGETDPAALVASIVSEAETGASVTVPDGPAAKALEILRAKAEAQREYWRLKQSEYPGVEDFTDEDGNLEVPHDIGPLLSGREANGRYSEADWWRSSIREVSEAVVRPPASAEGLVAFAKEMIACSRLGGDADGGFIQDKAVESGLLIAESFDPSRHSDPDGFASNGDQWFVYHGPLRHDVSPVLAVATTPRRPSDEISGADRVLSRVAAELPGAFSDVLHDAWTTLLNRYAWHISFPRAAQIADYPVELEAALDRRLAEKAVNEKATR